MTDYRLKAETGEFQLTGNMAELGVSVSVEHWQFFAFVFAAAASLAFGLVDAWGFETRMVRLVLKLVLFGVLGYATLYSWRVKSFLIHRLPTIKRRG
jgi:hypothetical protein